MAELHVDILLMEHLNKDVVSACNGFVFFLKEINICDPQITTLYAQGEALEEALAHKVMDMSGYIHPDIARYIGEDLPIASSLWDGKEDKGMSIMMVKFSAAATKIIISLENIPKIYTRDNLVNFITSVTEKYPTQYLSVYHTGEYKPVFADRPGVGWMLYLPEVIKNKSLKHAEEVIPISTQLSTGTIIISKRDYDYSDKLHRNASNDIEMALVDLGLLPLYSELKEKFK